MKLLHFTLLIFIISCNTNNYEKNPHNFISDINRIWHSEQDPITKRDSLIKLYGVDHKLVKEQQEIYKNNHIINEIEIRNILDNYGWPDTDMVGEMGNFTICNVIQHADNDVRLKYLPMMKQAVKDKKLEARFLVRAQDRIATECGELQIYGGQMKYYPETKSFNVWPVLDPENIDKRRAEIGLEPIAVHLKNRFDFEWNLEEQIQRTKEFEMEKKKLKGFHNFKWLETSITHNLLLKFCLQIQSIS